MKQAKYRIIDAQALEEFLVQVRDIFELSVSDQDSFRAVLQQALVDYRDDSVHHRQIREIAAATTGYLDCNAQAIPKLAETIDDIISFVWQSMPSNELTDFCGSETTH